MAGFEDVMGYGGPSTVEQPSGWDMGQTQTALQNPSWQMPEGGTSGWGGFGRLGMDLLGKTLPNVLGAAAGYGFNSLMPGKASLTDVRNPEQIQGQQMGIQQGQTGMNRVNNLEQNPLSFGLPGDPMDPSTPAGKKRYDIINASRSADAARGMFSTGGSQARETNAVNNAVGNEYNNIWKQSMDAAHQGAATATSGPAMHFQQRPNPWAQLLGGIASPAVTGLAQGIMRNFGLSV